jgi:germination protein M
MHFRNALSLVALALVAAGCLHDGNGTETVTVRETVTETVTGTGPADAPVALTVYFLRDGKVSPVLRAVETGPQIGAAAVRELLKGPGVSDIDVDTAIPPGTQLESLTIEDGVASVDLSRQLTDDRALAQLVYTLTQFTTVKRVDYGRDAPAGRRAFEAQTPPILVETPLPGQEVEPGFDVAGTANTFEATFNYELRDASDRILKKDFVTATSGSGTRGTFAFTVPYEISRPQEGRLVVFELSAADGSRINETSIPLRLR